MNGEQVIPMPARPVAQPQTLTVVNPGTVPSPPRSEHTSVDSSGPNFVPPVSNSSERVERSSVQPVYKAPSSGIFSSSTQPNHIPSGGTRSSATTYKAVANNIKDGKQNFQCAPLGQHHAGYSTINQHSEMYPPMPIPECPYPAQSPQQSTCLQYNSPMSSSAIQGMPTYGWQLTATPPPIGFKRT